ncbi:hypothetical protein [Domibacillus epiphyticus]|uniref:Uncharacterized protein n=1 Tax=Domibacillus epiphyticus TaxID=1714355 RepID=A0A1V2AAC9_9BACI|nr:hypothetical protein [Domibacillus epiphyticus]OMP67900.1 hypothetical protein BTO28_05275 [Domibacillus epiphyticus]
MNEQIQQWIDTAQEMFGLSSFTRCATTTGYEKNEVNETDYRLIMEWLPPGMEERKEEDLNPDGTAVIEVDVRSGLLKSVVFVGGKAPQRGLTFLTGDKNEIVRWVEQMTGWTYGRHFIDSQSNHTYSFELAYKGVPVSPSGSIHVSLDDEKRLTFFSVYGQVPKENVIEETFTLTLESIQDIAFKRLVFCEVPSEEDEKWMPVYMIDEQFISNETGKPVVEELEVLEWKTKKNMNVKRKLIQYTPDEIDEEKIFDFPPHPDTKPITKKGRMKVKENSLLFLQSYSPKESGQWVLSNIRRSNGMIEARLTNKTDVSVVPRSWKLFLDKDSYDVISYQDNSWMLDQFEEYKNAEKAEITKEEAFDAIKPHLQLKKVYVLDGDTYRLYGQIDCHSAIHAVNGKVIHFVQ